MFLQHFLKGIIIHGLLQRTDYLQSFIHNSMIKSRLKIIQIIKYLCNSLDIICRQALQSVKLLLVSESLKSNHAILKKHSALIILEIELVYLAKHRLGFAPLIGTQLSEPGVNCRNGHCDRRPLSIPQVFPLRLNFLQLSPDKLIKGDIPRVIFDNFLPTAGSNVFLIINI